MSDLTLGICIALFAAALVYIRAFSPDGYHASLAVWSAWILSFATIELSAVSDRVHWNTLSWTAWELQSKSGVFSVAFVGGLAVLMYHIAFKFPRKKTFEQGPEGRNLLGRPERGKR